MAIELVGHDAGFGEGGAHGVDFGLELFACEAAHVALLAERRGLLDERHTVASAHAADALHEITGLLEEAFAGFDFGCAARLEVGELGLKLIALGGPLGEVFLTVALLSFEGGHVAAGVKAGGGGTDCVEVGPLAGALGEQGEVAADEAFGFGNFAGFGLGLGEVSLGGEQDCAEGLAAFALGDLAQATGGLFGVGSEVGGGVGVDARGLHLVGGVFDGTGGGGFVASGERKDGADAEGEGDRGTEVDHGNPSLRTLRGQGSDQWIMAR